MKERDSREGQSGEREGRENLKFDQMEIADEARKKMRHINFLGECGNQFRLWRAFLITVEDQLHDTEVFGDFFERLVI